MKVKARVITATTVEVEVDDKFAVIDSDEEMDKLTYQEQYDLGEELRWACWDEANRILGGDVQDVFRILDGESGTVIYER